MLNAASVSSSPNRTATLPLGDFLFSIISFTEIRYFLLLFLLIIHPALTFGSGGATGRLLILSVCLLTWKKTTRAEENGRRV